MPRAAATTERPAKDKRPRKSQLKTQYTDQILTELKKIRVALGYPTTAPRRPSVHPGETVKKTLLFHGGTSPPVDGPTHWKFRDLGTFIHIVCTENGRFSRTIRDPRAIPTDLLAANEHLVSLIKLRAELTTPSRTQPLVPPLHDHRELDIDAGDVAFRSSSPDPRPSQPGSVDLDDEESDIDISDLCATDRIQPSDFSHDDDTDLEVIESVTKFSSTRSSSRGEAKGDGETIPSERTNDFEIDELDSEEYKPDSPSMTSCNRNLSNSSGSVSAITVITWTK
ncbi:hypothetical protein F5878DRAFT_667039, partial [Lentinula raphanica]